MYILFLRDLEFAFKRFGKGVILDVTFDLMI